MPRLKGPSLLMPAATMMPAAAFDGDTISRATAAVIAYSTPPRGAAVANTPTLTAA